MRARLGMQAVPVATEDAELIRWLGEEVATQMVEELPEDQREAVRAHVLEDRGYAEIAADERLPEATVRKRVSRGLRVCATESEGTYEQRLHPAPARRTAACRRGPGGAPAPSVAGAEPGPARRCGGCGRWPARGGGADGRRRRASSCRATARRHAGAARGDAARLEYRTTPAAAEATARSCRRGSTADDISATVATAGGRVTVTAPGSERRP